jgi:hypothetical protein
MKAADLQNVILKETKTLSSAKLNEVLDFIIFIKERNRISRKSIPSRYQLHSLSLHEQDHVEEEFSDYKAIYPRE